MFILVCVQICQLIEPTTGIEPVTSSLPRKRSTPELRRLFEFEVKKYQTSRPQTQTHLERETGFEPATFSLEG